MRWLSLTLAALLVPGSSTAHAFCGFYVSSAGGQLFNDATMVVLMRRCIASEVEDITGKAAVRSECLRLR